MGLKFRPGWIPTLVTLALLPILIGLGFWQLDRAEQKRVLQAEYDRRSQAAPIEIAAAPGDPEVLRFHRVEARGHYEPEYQILLDNRVHDGKVGYYVLTPLRIRDSATRLLVNRGWVPLGESRQQLPDIATPEGEQKVRGIATVPLDRVFTLAPDSESQGWQTVWQFMDMQRYAELVPFPVQPVVVLLDPDAAAGGFVRQWGRLDAGIATHQGYAFQWFALALALITIYLFVNVEKTPDGKRR